jgi:hypothetical protein
MQVGEQELLEKMEEPLWGKKGMDDVSSHNFGNVKYKSGVRYVLFQQQ